MDRSTPSRRPFRFLPRVAAAWACCALALLLSVAAGAQIPAEGEPADVIFRSIDGTTGQPCVLDRLQLNERTIELKELVDTEPSRAVFTLRDVPLVDGRAYLATAWFDKVPYYFEFRGRFLDQDTNTVHVFQTTGDLQDVAVGGLSLIFKKAGELVNYEMLIEIDNQNRPQRTIAGTGIDLLLPVGATAIEATVHRGLEPQPARTVVNGNRLSIEAPLTPGRTRLQVRCRAEWRPGFEIPVECNLPIRAWSLMGSPDYLEYVSFELESDPDNKLPGVARFVGPPLDAGRSIAVRVDLPAGAAPETEIFSASAPADEPQQDQAPVPPKSRSLRVPLALLGLAVLLVALILAVRRRG